MRFSIEYRDRVSHFSDPDEAYRIVVEEVYGYSVRSPSAHAHLKGSEAQSFCELPLYDAYEDEDFVIEIL